MFLIESTLRSEAEMSPAWGPAKLDQAGFARDLMTLSLVAIEYQPVRSQGRWVNLAAFNFWKILAQLPHNEHLAQQHRLLFHGLLCS